MVFPFTQLVWPEDCSLLCAVQSADRGPSPGIDQNRSPYCDELAF